MMVQVKENWLQYKIISFENGVENSKDVKMHVHIFSNAKNAQCIIHIIAWLHA